MMERILAYLLDRTPIVSISTLSQSLQEYESLHIKKRVLIVTKKKNPFEVEGIIGEIDVREMIGVLRRFGKKIDDNGTAAPRLRRRRRKTLMCFFALVLKDRKKEEDNVFNFIIEELCTSQAFWSFC
ncbi:hypothetical protein Salat_0167900 [Sesamum alatum]|uniref:Uncharacterized protein n=1 Tax=Sesamum alatum TaxID=300844 RepID=A0AAE2CXJ6_9LAMI|nr:hypothetical protein Salat_0167900 [Sesamum alatum]